MAPRERLSPEEAQRRNHECRERYRETHADEIKQARRLDYLANAEERRAKKRQLYHAHIDRLVEAGVYTKLSAGRKRLYTPEEAVEVAKRQRRESYERRKERINAGLALLAQTELA